jgi:CIC family chloride channel protein
VVVASVVAAVTSHAFLGNNPAFPIPEEYGYALQRELLIFYPFLGLVAGLAAALFVRIFFGTEAVIRRLDLPAGPGHSSGAVVGLMVLLSGGLLVGHGHFAVHLDVFGHMSWYSLALLAVGSMIATSITLSSGGSGGVFTPSLYVGAATGGAFGVALAGLFPGLHLRPEPYALVGMGAVVAAATAAPITGILLVFEMTNDYEIVLPLMLATVIANVVARRIEPDSLYSGWLRRRGERLQHGADRDLLAGLRVADAFDPAPAIVGEAAPLDQLLDHLGAARRATCRWWTRTAGWSGSSPRRPQPSGPGPAPRQRRWWRSTWPAPPSRDPGDSLLEASGGWGCGARRPDRWWTAPRDISSAW